jgi:hypothetical protein
VEAAEHHALIEPPLPGELVQRLLYGAEGDRLVFCYHNPKASFARLAGETACPTKACKALLKMQKLQRRAKRATIPSW